MSTLIAQRLHLRCFLEGIEVPLISCVIQATINAPVAASINLVCLDEVLDFKSRTLVHIFFYDYTIDEPVDLEDLTKYKVLFIGELVSRSYVKSPTGRSFVFQCTDLSTNWDLSYQYMITYGPNGNFITEESANWAGENSIFNNIVDGHAQVLARYLEATPKTVGLQKIKGLLGGIIALLEALGGTLNHRAGVNDYYTISEFKNKTMQQIVAEEDDNTAQRLFESKEFYQWLENGVTSLGELCTLRDMIRMLFNYIYYEVVPITSPMYIPGDTQVNAIEDKVGIVTDSIDNIIERLTYSSKEIKVTGFGADNVETFQQVFGPYAEENLLILIKSPLLQKEQVKLINKALIFVQAATRDTNKFVSKVTLNADKIVVGNVDYKLKANITKNIDSAIAALNAAKKQSPKKAKEVSVDRLNSFIFRPECYFVAPPRCSVIFPEHESQFNYDRNDVGEITRLRLQSGMSFGIDSEKLLASYACAPAMKEMQELAKKQGTHGIRALLPWEKFTGIRPKFAYINEINYIANKKQKDLQKNIIGQAISYKQKAANFNYFKARYESRSINLQTKFNPFLVCGFPCLIIDKPFIIDRTIAKNSLNKGGGNLLDIEVTTDQLVKNIQDLAKDLKAPTQFLGMVQTLTHSLDSTSGGVTTAVLSHARTHRINEDDFLIAFQEQKSKEAELVTKVTYLDAEQLLNAGDTNLLQFLIGATPQNILSTKTTKAKPVPKTKLATRPKITVDGLEITTPIFSNISSEIEPTNTTGDVIDLTMEDGNVVKVPANYGTIKPGSKGPLGGVIKYIVVVSDEVIRIPTSLSTSKTKAKTSQKTKYAWKSAMFYEQVNSNRVNKLIPVEEVLRPNWFSPWYSNLYIGDKIYKPFLRTGSIVDQLVFDSPTGLSIQGVGAERATILNELESSSTLVEDVTKLTQNKLFNIPDIETATDILAFQYGEVRRLGLDANKFINNYTSRPIATLVDIFGTADLQYERVGNKLQIKTVNGKKGVPGFHSAAVAPFGDLLGIVDNPDIDYPVGNQKGSFKISKQLDPRPERRAAVLAYAERLRGDGGEIIALQG
jgi:hypothetical protein